MGINNKRNVDFYVIKGVVEEVLDYVKEVNGDGVDAVFKRKSFDDLKPIYPNEKFDLDIKGFSDCRLIDVISPIGKGQRGMIVAPPKAGKTTLLKNLANGILKNNKDIYMIVLLIDERPEEVTDIKESITGDNVHVIYSTFDELPENHVKVAEMVLERAKRLTEQKKDVVIFQHFAVEYPKDFRHHECQGPASRG